jgi:glucose/arabinose dehydrogenase
MTEKESTVLKRFLITAAAVALLSVSAVAQDAPDAPILTRESAPSPANIRLVDVADGLQNPLYVTHAQDDSGRMFIVEQAGRIWVMENGSVLESPFLDLSDIVSQDVLNGYSERGLLGLVFSPNYAEDGTFWVNYTDNTRGTTYIARYRVSGDPNVADKTSGQVIFSLPQPFPNHNGGHMAFGPDGYLYVSLGDGGAAGDPLKAGQDLNQLLGKLLRLDVVGQDVYAIPESNPFADGAQGLPEIWAYGVRNVWRFSFDRATGDLYIADVGQNLWEEVNFQPADSTGGENYGWNIFEASYPYATGTPPENMVYPIAEYEHRGGHCSVTGGYMYRGEAIPDLQGVYLFGDFCSGQIWATYRDMDNAWQTIEFISTGLQISSFGEDENGELYVIDYNGTVKQIVPNQ